MPVYRTIPVCKYRMPHAALEAITSLSGNGEELHGYAREGPTKKAAMEAAATAIALSGHCVRLRSYTSDGTTFMW